MKIFFEVERTGSACLIICGFARYQNITKIVIIPAERQYIGGLVKTSIFSVVAPNYLIGHENDRERLFSDAEICHQPREESTHAAFIHRMSSLPVKYKEAGLV